MVVVIQSMYIECKIEVMFECVCASTLRQKRKIAEGYVAYLAVGYTQTVIGSASAHCAHTPAARIQPGKKGDTKKGGGFCKHALMRTHSYSRYT